MPMLVLGWGEHLSALLVSLMVLQLALVDRNPFRFYTFLLLLLLLFINHIYTI